MTGRAARGDLQSRDVAAAPVRLIRADHHPGPGIERQQQLRHVRAGSQPPVIGLDAGHHVLRLPVEGHGPCPRQQRTAALRGRVRLAVGGEVAGRQPGPDAGGQGLLDEDVLFEGHRLARAGRPQRGEERPRGLGELRPGQRPHDRLKERHAQGPSGVTGRPVEGQHAAPVVTDQDHPVQGHGLEPGIEVPGMIGELVFDRRLAGVADADQVRCQQRPAPPAASPSATSKRRSGCHAGTPSESRPPPPGRTSSNRARPQPASRHLLPVLPNIRASN